MAEIIGRIRAVAVLGLLLAGGRGFDTVARGQGAVAFQPSIGIIPNGATLNLTPVVSADRRYVRIGANPYFISTNGFTTYSSPLGVVGGTGFAGMNGPIGEAGMGARAQRGQPPRPFTGTYAAGDYPFSAGGVARAGFPNAADAFDPRIDGPNPGTHRQPVGAARSRLRQSAISTAADRSSFRAASRSKPTPRRSAAKSSRRPRRSRASKRR